MSDSEISFTISIPEQKLSLLRRKLELTNFPDELEHSGWEYGVPLKDLRRLVERWSNGYDWRKHEAQLNSELPQFSRDIKVTGHGTLNIHYIHKKSEVTESHPAPVRPGGFFEVRKLLPLLTEVTADHPAFHVVALSLPGYGFSEAPTAKGFDLEQYAEVCNKLMMALGYYEYVTQGGDWGLPITCKIANIYGGKHSMAWHTNMPLGKAPGNVLEENLTPKEKAGLERVKWFQRSGGGYLGPQSTQPQTLGYSLADSPAGLLAWIYEKLVNWTDSYSWEDDEVLTWVSVYWFSRAGPTASLRLYFEAEKRDMNVAFSMAPPRPTIPLGLSHFLKDILPFPISWTRGMGNVVFDGEHDSGGHFAAYERPEALAGDLRKMFGKGGPAFNVVAGQSGYAQWVKL
ncbi:Alpha/Beta hydrolase protein [Mycena rebaudengoi]|nr:Alpha/Beta hydrolase protein [Mycena rebaudengoi]